MAGGRDLKLETARIRREQAERNRLANEEREKRVAETDEILRRKMHRRDHRPRRRNPKITRVGHKLSYVEPGSLEGVAFASKAAEKKAIDAALGWEDFAGRKPSSKNGYTSQDVTRATKAKLSRDAVSDKMDRGESAADK